MSDLAPVCIPCSEKHAPLDGHNEVRFRVKRNGIYIPYGKTQVQHSNLWRCPGCGHEILLDFVTIPTDIGGRVQLLETAKKWGDLAMDVVVAPEH